MELTKEDTKMLQGLSVLAMVCLHLFDRWDYEGLYQPLIFLRGIPLSFYLGQLSDFCVMGFAFCSGYAHYVQHMQKGTNIYIRRLRGFLILLCNYWIILIVFSIVSVLVGQGAWMPGNASTFLGTALLYRIAYNGAWWYMYAYAILVLISPIVLKAVERRNSMIVLAAGFVIYVVAYWVRFKIDGASYHTDVFGKCGMTLFEYIIGCVCCKTRLISHAFTYWKRIPAVSRIALSIALLIGMLLGRTIIVPSLFVAPISGAIVMMLFHFCKKPDVVKRFFLLIGKHSTNIWLTHMFFYLVLFKNLVYRAKYPLLIFAFMIALTLSVSIVLHLIQDPLTKRIEFKSEGKT